MHYCILKNAIFLLWGQWSIFTSGPLLRDPLPVISSGWMDGNGCQPDRGCGWWDPKSCSKRMNSPSDRHPMALRILPQRALGEPLRDFSSSRCLMEHKLHFPQRYLLKICTCTCSPQRKLQHRKQEDIWWSLHKERDKKWQTLWKQTIKAFSCLTLWWYLDRCFFRQEDQYFAVIHYRFTSFVLIFLWPPIYFNCCNRKTSCYTWHFLSGKLATGLHEPLVDSLISLVSQ